jgi:translocator protein
MQRSSVRTLPTKTAVASLHWGVVAAFALTIFVNYLANALPLAGRTTGQISDGLPTLLTPAPYVFGIWGLIYLGLAVYVVIQLLPVGRTQPKLQNIAPWFIASCLFNSLWIVVWHYGVLTLSVLLMLGLLVSLVIIYRRIRTVENGDWWIVRWTFSLYLGWIVVAMVVNVSAALVGWGWNSGWLGAQGWAFVMIAVASGIGLAFLWLARDTTIPLVLVWALVGIAVAQWGDATAWIALLFTGLLMYAVFARRRIRWDGASVAS